MAIFMPVTSNESQSFLTKVENPSQILNFITGANRTLLSRENHQQIFGSYYFKDDNIEIMNESKKRLSLLSSEVMMEKSNNANDSDSDVSVGQEKIDDNKIVNNYQKMKTKSSFDNSTTSTRGGDDDDNSSNESSSPRFGFNNSSSRMSIPIVNQKLFVGNSPLFAVTGGNPTGNLQEEILRNSQVYAGELMRHQLAAAAQLQSLSGVQSFQSNFDSPMTEHHSFNFESSDSLQDKFPRLFSPKKSRRKQ